VRDWPPREWLVGGAVIERDGALLLVQNRRRDGSHDWTPPGGVIDEGESVLEGLSREVEEETGLVVTSWERQIYEVEVAAAGLGWTLRVESWRANDVSGELRLDDPDGIVVDARFVPFAACASHFDTVPSWVREPVGEWLAERWAGVRPFRYEVVGSDRTTTVVHRR
jgi:8-oxo-dGTP diphosphatase